jgi:formylglycine-generating enzyme
MGSGIGPLWCILVAAGCAEIGGFQNFTSDCPVSHVECRANGGASATATSGNGHSQPGGAPARDGGAPAAGGEVGGGPVRDGGDAMLMTPPLSGAGGRDGGAQPKASGGAGGFMTDATRRLAGDPTIEARGPVMAHVTRADGTAFWIDETEVTRAEYADFLHAHVTPQRTPVCPYEGARDGASGSAPFAPDPACLAGGDGGRDANTDELPVNCVDYCDAAAFCAWAGDLSLCADHANQRTPSVHENDFVQACEGTGTPQSFGCRNTPGQSDCQSGCNGREAGYGAPRPVGGLAACWANSDDPDHRIYDLSGNVSEWVEDCSDTRHCKIAGGDYDSLPEEMMCTSGYPDLSPDAAYPTVGFRCCAEAR